MDMGLLSIMDPSKPGQPLLTPSKTNDNNNTQSFHDTDRDSGALDLSDKSSHHGSSGVNDIENDIVNDDTDLTHALSRRHHSSLGNTSSSNSHSSPDFSPIPQQFVSGKSAHDIMSTSLPANSITTPLFNSTIENNNKHSPKNLINSDSVDPATLAFQAAAARLGLTSLRSTENILSPQKNESSSTKFSIDNYLAAASSMAAMATNQRQQNGGLVTPSPEKNSSLFSSFLPSTPTKNDTPTSKSIADVLKHVLSASTFNSSNKPSMSTTGSLPQNDLITKQLNSFLENLRNKTSNNFPKFSPDKVSHGENDTIKSSSLFANMPSENLISAASIPNTSGLLSPPHSALSTGPSFDPTVSMMNLSATDLDTLPYNSSITSYLAQRKRRADQHDIIEPIPKKIARTIPEDKKDEAYWDRRRKNNEAAKRSRDARRAKEEAIALRASFLEQENLKLRAQVTLLKNETAKLHYMLYSRV